MAETKRGIYYPTKATDGGQPARVIEKMEQMANSTNDALDDVQNIIEIKIDKINSIEIGKNKFNYKKVQEYKTINNIGQIIDSANRYLLSEKIYLNNNAQNITVSYVTSMQRQVLLNNAIIAFYNSDEEFILKISNSQVEIPEGAYFCYVLIANTSYADSDNRQRIQVEFSDEMSDFEKYKETIKKELLNNTDKIIKMNKDLQYTNNVLSNSIEIGKNKFNYKKVQEYKTINNIGQIIDSANRYLLSEKIYLNNNAQNITVSYVTNMQTQILLNNAIIAFYNSDEEFILKISSSQAEIPKDACFCYVLITSASYADSDNRQRIQVEFSDAMSDFEKYYKELDDEILIPKIINSKDIQSKIVLGEITQIKLIGDSITHGVGGTNFPETYGDGEEFLIVDELDAATGGRKFKVNTTGYCWANLFKSYIESKYNNITVKNYGNRGMSAGRWLTMGHTFENNVYKTCIEQLIEENDDLVICMIGTNDRTYDNYNNYISHMQQLINYIVNERKKQLVLVSSIPASVANETNGNQNFHMEDVDNVITALSAKNNIVNISLYKKFLKYCNLKNIQIDSLLRDGLHPNDTGYELMFKMICDGLEIAIKRDGATW